MFLKLVNKEAVKTIKHVDTVVQPIKNFPPDDLRVASNQNNSAMISF